MKRILETLRISQPKLEGPYRDLRIGLIADELTSACLVHECQVRNVTPLNYRVLLKAWRPDLLFVESAWHGPNNAWKYKIAAYPDYPKRTNESLRKVVEFARELGVPCIFWNKEDGVHFERFIASASLFDKIFTVDVNCVERYRAKLGSDVVVAPLMFAVQPAIHYPAGVGYKYQRACFPGSYSHHIHDRRRHWQEILFSAATEIGLTIFDRNSNRKSAVYRYPNLPGLEMRKVVPHDKTANIYRDYMISLNVNTIEDSDTMFSRRLIEILGCGGLAVTTPAKSVDRYFRDYCYVVSSEDEARDLFKRLKDGWGEKEHEMARAGAEYVHQNHTWSHRIETVLNTIGN